MKYTRQNLEIYVKKRRLHVVSSTGRERLKVRIREGSVVDLSHIRKAYASRILEYTFKKTKIACCFEYWKGASKSADSGGVSC